MVYFSGQKIMKELLKNLFNERSDLINKQMNIAKTNYSFNKLKPLSLRIADIETEISNEEKLKKKVVSIGMAYYYTN